MGELLELLLHGAQFVEDGEAFLEDGAAGEGEAILRQVADGHAFGALHRAVVERVEPGENLHERGLAGAVGADEGGALVGRDEPVGVFKEKFVTETFAGVGELKHKGILSGRMGVEEPCHVTSDLSHRGMRWRER